MQDELSIHLNDIAKIEKLLTIMSKLDDLELSQLLDEAEKITKYKKIRESLAQYEPSNPLITNQSNK